MEPKASGTIYASFLGMSADRSGMKETENWKQKIFPKKEIKRLAEGLLKQPRLVPVMATVPSREKR
jgi:hypothetical protein